MIKVRIETNIGNMIAELDSVRAPYTVSNFLRYVEDGYYANTIFHRVIKNFMIQGGGFATNMVPKMAVNTVQNEGNNGLRNVKYTLAMARIAAPHSATSQFFINTADNGFLDYPGQDGWGYCVFGKIIEGQEVVDNINLVETTRSGIYSDVPKVDVVILSITVIEDPDMEKSAVDEEPSPIVQEVHSTLNRLNLMLTDLLNLKTTMTEAKFYSTDTLNTMASTISSLNYTIASVVIDLRCASVVEIPKASDGDDASEVETDGER